MILFEGSYDDVVTALKKRYDKCKELFTCITFLLSTHVHQLRRPHSRTTQELELNHGGLKAHSGNSLGQYLTASTVLLMDPACSTHWADYTSSLKEPPDLDTVLEHHIVTLQANPHTAKKGNKPLPQPSILSYLSGDETRPSSVHRLKSVTPRRRSIEIPRSGSASCKPLRNGIFFTMPRRQDIGDQMISPLRGRQQNETCP